nr:hypothetical protein [Pseudopedobacter sp.]
MKTKLIILLALIFIYGINLSTAQSSLGIRFTPNITNQPKVDNASPTRLYGQNRLSFNTGLDYTRFFKNKPYGIRTGLGVGVIDYNYVFEAPYKAFGNSTREGNAYENNNFENYAYASLSLAFVYQFKIKNLLLETYLGATKKFYQYANESDAFGLAIRDQPYNFDDPNAGPPDLFITYPPINGRLHVDIPFGIGIVRKYSDRSSLTMSLVKNWTINPIVKGDLFVQAYGKTYTGGEFSPRSSYIGLDIRYSYSLGKKQFLRSSENIAEKKEEKSGYIKTAFIELLGAGGIGSANIDVRLKKNRQDGFGLRAGFGLGEYFAADLSSDQSGRYYSIPIGINYLLGKRRNSLELGTVFTPQFTFKKTLNDPKIAALGFINFGYRFQPLKEGLVFRAGWQPFYSTRKGLFSTFIGTSIGYGFK